MAECVKNLSSLSILLNILNVHLCSPPEHSLSAIFNTS
jgi:hypothetical protein